MKRDHYAILLLNMGFVPLYSRSNHCMIVVNRDEGVQPTNLSIDNMLASSWIPLSFSPVYRYYDNLEKELCV